MFVALGSVELDFLGKSRMMGKRCEEVSPVVVYIYPRRSRTEYKDAYSDSSNAQDGGKRIEASMCDTVAHLNLTLSWDGDEKHNRGYESPDCVYHLKTPNPRTIQCLLSDRPPMSLKLYSFGMNATDLN